LPLRSSIYWRTTRSISRINSPARHENKFAEIDHIIPECGAPVLIGSAAHFECRNEYRHYGGDHIIFIGHVERYAHTSKPTLLFCRGKYMRGEPLIPP
jgi:flavin reductase (DIM6/NTAB) family NADH-FMN oxidoreductase RutF